MGNWKHNIELYERIVIDEAVRRKIITPAERHEMDQDEIMDLLEERDDFHEIVTDAEADYWGGRIDDAMMRCE